MFLGILSPRKKELFAVTYAGSLQNFPFTNTTQRKLCYCRKEDSFVTVDNNMSYSEKKKSNLDDIM